MFVDASAMVAILAGEPEAAAFTEALDRAETRITSPIAVFETVLGLTRLRHATVDEAEADVTEFLRLADIACVPITPQDTHSALLAFARYGKGRGHPAQLNLGDCFAYAVARSHDVALLFKGNDFSQTDVTPAAGV